MICRSVSKTALRTIAIFTVFGLLALSFGQSTYVDRHDFGATGDLSGPSTAVSFDAAGDMFGAAGRGGTHGEGGVWEVTASGTYKVLHYFGGTITYANGASGPDGADPDSPIVIDGSGDLLGTASIGGPNYSNVSSVNYGGIIWEITAAGTYQDLHDFGGTVTNADGAVGPDGQLPTGSLYRDSTGDLFGTTELGGPFSTESFPYKGGTLWELTSEGVYIDLHDFGFLAGNESGITELDGQGPEGGVAGDSKGNLFGTAASGGSSGASEDGAGMVWELTGLGEYTDLHDFGSIVTNADGQSGPDGSFPDSNVVFDFNGNMFGTASGGGANNLAFSPAGMMWEITAGGIYKDIHDFGGLVTDSYGKTGPDGANPEGTLAIDHSGNVYGTTQQNGPNFGYGNIWEYASAGQYTDLHDFGGTIVNANATTGLDGAGATGVAFDPYGNFWGTCNYGGPADSGMVWELKAGRIAISLYPTTIGGLGTATGVITLAQPAPSGGLMVDLVAGASGYLNLQSSITVPANALTATFTIIGTAQRSATLGIGIIATSAVGSSEAILTVQGDVVNGLSFSPSTIGPNGSTTATVTLTSAAPPGGWIIYPKAAAAGYLNMPASVTVPAGATSTTFTITGANQRTGTAGIGVIASDDNASVESILTVEGDALAGISLSPTAIGPNGISTATLTLTTTAPEGGWVVNLKAGAPGYLSMPASVTVPAGATTATFSITGVSQRAESATIGVIANDTGNQVEADLTLTGDSLTGVSVSPTSVAPGSGSTGTVTLSGPAPVGGWVVKLQSAVPTDVVVPATVTVPAGATSATFSITTPTNAVPSKYGVFANDGTAQFETFLTIT